MGLVVALVAVLVVLGSVLALRSGRAQRNVRHSSVRPSAPTATPGPTGSVSMTVGPSAPRPPSGALVSPLPSMAPDPTRLVRLTRSASSPHPTVSAAAATPQAAAPTANAGAATTAPVTGTTGTPSAASAGRRTTSSAPTRPSARRVPVARTSVPARPAASTVPGPLGPTATVSPAPGWFPDPEDATRWRWWDGSGWTQHRS